MLFSHRAKTAHFCSLMDWFLTSWTLKITGLLNLNKNHIDLSMVKGFHGFIMFSLSYSKIGWILFRNTKEVFKEMRWPENVHIVGWQTYEGLKININSIVEATQFLLWHQVKYVLTERFCQDPLKNWFGRQRSLGSTKDNPVNYGWLWV